MPAPLPICYRYEPLERRRDWTAWVDSAALPPGEWRVLTRARAFLRSLDFWAGRVASWQVTVGGTGESPSEDMYYSGASTGLVPQLLTYFAAETPWTPDPRLWRRLDEDDPIPPTATRPEVSDTEYRAIDERAVVQVDFETDRGRRPTAPQRTAGFYAPTVGASSTMRALLSGTLTLNTWHEDDGEWVASEVDSIHLDTAPRVVRPDIRTPDWYYQPVPDVETIVGGWTFPPAGDGPALYQVVWEPYRWWPYTRANGTAVYNIVDGGPAVDG